MHIGVGLPFGSAHDVARLARLVEDSGLDGLWTADHLAQHEDPWLDSASVLTAAAAVTSRISVGWAVMLPALRPVPWAAKQIATVQHVSGGRLQLGVGIGPAQFAAEWAAVGIDPSRRAASTDAFLAALPGLLDGRPYPAGDDAITLRPSVPVPPLWIGGTSDAALRRVVRTGAGWLSSLLTPDELAARRDRLEGLAREAGVPAPPVATTVFATPAEDPRRHTPEPVVRWLVESVGLAQGTAARLAVGGGPERMADAFSAYLRAGADTLVVNTVSPDVTAAYGIVGRARALLPGSAGSTESAASTGECRERRGCRSAGRVDCVGGVTGNR